VHENKKDFPCNKCSYAAAEKKSLNYHIKTVHEKNFEHCCTLCDYKCGRRGDLSRHIKVVHQLIKDFNCRKCEYGASDKRCLQRHIRNVHNKIIAVEPGANVEEPEGISEFVCLLCQVSFHSKPLLLEHMRLSHSKETLDPSRDMTIVFRPAGTILTAAEVAKDEQDHSTLIIKEETEAATELVREADKTGGTGGREEAPLPSLASILCFSNMRPAGYVRAGFKYGEEFYVADLPFWNVLEKPAV
jgi:hypothetical protein